MHNKLKTCFTKHMSCIQWYWKIFKNIFRIYTEWVNEMSADLCFIFAHCFSGMPHPKKIGCLAPCPVGWLEKREVPKINFSHADPGGLKKNDYKKIGVI